MDFSDEDGIKAAELQAEYAELGGYESESDASRILQGLGVILSSSFRRAVACLDLDLLAEKREINSLSSWAFSSHQQPGHQRHQLAGGLPAGL